MEIKKLENYRFVPIDLFGIYPFISGMFGLGVAFSAIPFLGLFIQDLVHQVQPLSLLLNGVTIHCSTYKSLFKPLRLKKLVRKILN